MLLHGYSWTKVIEFHYHFEGVVTDIDVGFVSDV